MNQHRFLRLLKLIELMQTKSRYLHTIARYLSISERSVYRYMKCLESAGYKIEKDFKGKFVITDKISIFELPPNQRG